MLASLPTASDLAELIRHRDEASVSIYLPSSPMLSERNAVRIALKNAVAQAVARLEGLGIDSAKRSAIADAVNGLEGEFWEHQANGLAVLVSPGVLRTFRLDTDVPELIAVADRFDVGPLLRSLSSPHVAYVLAVTEGGARLFLLSAERRPREVPLRGLPHDLHTVLEKTAIPDQAAYPRANGSSGQKIEQQKYCRLVQEAVLSTIDESGLPLILAASDDLEPAYRAINGYDGLLPRGIDPHPDSLSPEELDAQAREILDAHHREELSAWRELFGTKRSNGRATSKLDEVARAATAGAVDELLFDADAVIEGSIDETGTVQVAPSPEQRSYGIVDEIAVRVLEAGGLVRAVDGTDMVDDSPVSATLRYPIENL